MHEKTLLSPNIEISILILFLSESLHTRKTKEMFGTQLVESSNDFGDNGVGLYIGKGGRRWSNRISMRITSIQTSRH